MTTYDEQVESLVREVTSANQEGKRVFLVGQLTGIVVGYVIMVWLGRKIQLKIWKKAENWSPFWRYLYGKPSGLKHYIIQCSWYAAPTFVAIGVNEIRVSYWDKWKRRRAMARSSHPVFTTTEDGTRESIVDFAGEGADKY